MNARDWIQLVRCRDLRARRAEAALARDHADASTAMDAAADATRRFEEAAERQRQRDERQRRALTEGTISVERLHHAIERMAEDARRTAERRVELDRRQQDVAVAEDKVAASRRAYRRTADALDWACDQRRQLQQADEARHELLAEFELEDAARAKPRGMPDA
ncbi:hypothetical protein GCM10011611_08550 [Aliidongia dinghuensis]|uniref:Uncharacterized protein n=1 Tax=Aliidongia dinghuensis TaxID=1867774 RepID=A0A8J3E0V9_9PROT|nr:hypothetical protein [Aliidongia dinghuensis]GGF05354.1 hypothetical protein GCM10011611_08550 [Aliidongia dinghuensis]